MALLRVVDRDGVEHEVDAKPGLKVMETLRELDYGSAARVAQLALQASNAQEVEAIVRGSGFSGG